ncbi:MAG: AAA family ATPase, partial [Thermoplasmata archaeon]
QGPYTPFSTKIDSTTWETSINAYPSGTKIRFWIVAYDKYNTPLTSQEYVYTVEEYEPFVTYLSQLVILVVDENADAIPDARVHIRNGSWSADFVLDQEGYMNTPFLYHGSYTIIITYGDYRDIRGIDIDQETNLSLTFQIDKAKLLSEQHGIESFPQWYTWAAFAVVLLFIPLLIFGMSERRKEMMSKKRADKIYRRMEDHHEAKPWDPFLLPFQPILKLFEEEQKRVGISQFIAFFVLGLAGTMWAPFYPWWLIILLAFAIASISYRFPYLALIILSVFVLAATAYQAPEFGMVFLIFSLIMMICAFFSWKFGYLVFLTVFLSRLGIMIFVPITTALLYSVFLGISVMVVSGLFLSFLITRGNVTNLSFLIGPPHKSAFIIFNKPAPSEFLPIQFVDALASLNEPNFELMNTIFRDNYNTMVPIIQIVVWAIAIYLIYFIAKKYSEKTFEQFLSYLILPLVVFPITALCAVVYFEFDLTPEFGILSMAMIGVGMAAVLTASTVQDLYPSIFKREIERDIIGTRISQLMTLRRSSFKSVGGLTEVKKELRNAITIPLLRPKLSRLYGVNPPKGVMLFGPPGCGKTLIMRALATELNVEMIGVKCSDIMSKWYGESEEMTSRMFTIAKARRPCILFLDEIDAVAKRRSFYSTDDVTPRLLSIMLNELDGMDESAGIMVVGATNMPELIDPALLRPGRFDKIIYVPPPEFAARKEIFRLYLKNKPLAPGVNFYELAGASEGFSGADIENVVKEASMRAMRRTLETHRRSFITMDDFRVILEQIKPSISKKMQKEYEKLGFDYGRKTEPSKKKKKRKFGISVKEEEEEEEKAPIPVGESDIRWDEEARAEEEEEEEAEEEEEEPPKEPQVWDKYVPPKKKRKDVPRRRPAVESDEEVVFEPVDADEEEGEEEIGEEMDMSADEEEVEEEKKVSKPKRKGAYHPVWDDNNDEEEEAGESSEDYWM